LAARESLPSWDVILRDGARERIHRFNVQGIDGLGDRPGAGRKKPRLTETERCSWIISLVATDPPGRLLGGAGGESEARDEEKEAHYWTLDALTPPLPESSTVSLSDAAR
jgi:hypothetical protein